MPNDVEVLIVSYNSADVIGRCLTSVDATMPGVPVAIREHGSNPAARERLEHVAAAHSAPVRLEFDASNPGFGAGCNALAGGSNARWLLFLNPDTEVLRWPWRDTDPPARSIVGATFVQGGGVVTNYGTSYRIVDEIARSWLRRSGRRPEGSGFVSGAALLVEAASFEAIGGFDERYFLFYEDIDLCLRANELGIPTTVQADWLIRHAGAHSTSGRFGESLAWSYESGSRFHAARSESVAAYRAYVVADALGRAALHILGDRGRAPAYWSLARQAASDLVHRRP